VVGTSSLRGSLVLLFFRRFAKGERGVRIDVQNEVVRPAVLFSYPVRTSSALKKIRAEVVRRDELVRARTFRVGRIPSFAAAIDW
jgi:hypothetical protein